MVENTSRDGCRADQFKISDTPHTRYYNNGVPIPTTIVNGNLSVDVIELSIIYYTVSCPDCQIDIYYDEDEEPVCENCGLIVGGAAPRTADGQPLLSDAKSAGRVKGD